MKKKTFRSNQKKYWLYYGKQYFFLLSSELDLESGGIKKLIHTAEISISKQSELS